MINLAQYRYQYLSVIVVVLGVIFCSCEKSESIMGGEPREIIDVTLDAELSVSHENPDGPSGNEGSNKLVDNDAETKFLIFDYDSDFWAEQELDEPEPINSYSLTSGNDAPERDPADWILEGSDDGNNWETIDTQTDTVFDGRNKTFIYDLDSEVAYQYFRLSVTENAGETTLLQISEWRLLYFE